MYIVPFSSYGELHFLYDEKLREDVYLRKGTFFLKRGNYETQTTEKVEAGQVQKAPGQTAEEEISN